MYSTLDLNIKSQSKLRKISYVIAPVGINMSFITSLYCILYLMNSNHLSIFPYQHSIRYLRQASVFHINNIYFFVDIQKHSTCIIIVAFINLLPLITSCEYHGALVNIITSLICSLIFSCHIWRKVICLRIATPSEFQPFMNCMHLPHVCILNTKK